MAKKGILFFLALLTTVSLFSASYSILLPERAGESVLIMNEDGFDIYLDDSIYYKRWNGLLLEQYESEGAYTIEDDDFNKVLIFVKDSNSYMKESLIRRLSDDLIAIVVLEGSLDSSFLSNNLDDTLIISLRRIEERDKLRLERAGLDYKEVSYGAVIDIEDEHVAIREQKSIEVKCPYCGRTIRVYV